MQSPERKREWARANPKPQPLLPDRVEAADRNWLVLTCTRCFSLFDVPRNRRGRLPEVCCPKR